MRPATVCTILASLALLSPAGCASTRRGEEGQETFHFRIRGAKGRPGFIPEGAPEKILRLLEDARGVELVHFWAHPGNRLDNRVTVTFDSRRTGPPEIAEAAAEEWEIEWYRCSVCRMTSAERGFCHGVRMEEGP